MIYRVFMQTERLGAEGLHAGWVSAEDEADAEVKGRAKVEQNKPYSGPNNFLRVELMTDEQIIDGLESFPQ